MSEELKPCPFCGGKNMRYEPTEQSIFCIRCGASGPYKHFPYSPDEIWNTRHEPDELPEWFVDAIKNRINWWVNHIVMKAPELREEIADGAGHIDALKWVLSLRKPEVKE